jgi:hypothetical protein
MITMTCLILWIATGAFGGVRCVPASSAEAARTAATAAPKNAIATSELRMTLLASTVAL